MLHLSMNNMILMWLWIFSGVTETRPPAGNYSAYDIFREKKNTGYLSRQWLEFVLAVREMSGKSQGIFSCQVCGNPG